jgi:hypothetical protein
MNLKKSTIEAMKERQSVRTYDVQDISESHKKQIIDYITDEQNLIGPLGKEGRIEFVQVTNNVTDKGIKLGTYGFIKNPRAFLVGKTSNDKFSILEFGFIFQKLVLLLTELGLGTCWMGGTFNRNSFQREIDLVKGEFIPCITPLGYPNGKQRVVDKAIRIVAKSDNRKPWEQIIYDESFDNTLTKEKAGQMEIPIEMVRIGPSASNKQPWRLVLSSNRQLCHFYLEHTPNYSKKLGYDMQLLDLGIAMCQFELACKELKLNGQWVVEEPKIKLPNEHFEYLVSWRNC